MFQQINCTKNKDHLDKKPTVEMFQQTFLYNYLLKDYTKLDNSISRTYCDCHFSWQYEKQSTKITRIISEALEPKHISIRNAWWQTDQDDQNYGMLAFVKQYLI